MQPECSTATTRPGKGPGMPGLDVEALLWTWPRAAAPARAVADRRKSRRRAFVTMRSFYTQWNREFEGFRNSGSRGRRKACLRARLLYCWDSDRRFFL